MALKGNLRDYPAIHLFRLISLAQKSGALHVEGADETVTLFFRAGQLAYAQSDREDNLLVTVLHRAKKLTTPQYRLLLERAAAMRDKELGLLLVNANYLTQKDILASLESHYTALAKRLLTWREGLFHFDAEAVPPEDKIAVRVSLDNLIIEGTRQLRELEHLQEEIPTLDLALKFADRPGANVRNLNLSADEWQVVRYVNPKNSLKQIAKACRMDELRIRKAVYALLQAGIVELVRPEGVAFPLPAMAGGLAFATTSVQEQRSLINRLINRIRSL